MNDKVLIDTGAWIDFLRAKEGQLGDEVATAIEQGNALFCSVTIAELLQGAKGPKEARQLEFLFANVECLAIEHVDWISAGHNLQTLRNKGFQIPLTDALIASLANRHQVAVLTIDAHFRHLDVRLASGA